MGLAASIEATCDRCGAEKFNVVLEPGNYWIGVIDMAKDNAPDGWDVSDDLVCCSRCRVLCSLCDKPVGADYRNATFVVEGRFGVRSCAICAACRAKIPQPPSR